MNPFSAFLNDTVYIENHGGERSGPYKAAIGNKNGLSATIFEQQLDVEEGWKLVRSLPNGKEEKYTILEANYSPGLQAIPPHWVLKLRKDTSLIKSEVEKKTTTIHIRNSQGIQIGDNNIQNITNSLEGLIELINSSPASEEEKRKAKGLIRKLVENPIVASVLGAATSGLFGLLKE